MRGWAELHCASAFSFLEGASLPEDLAVRAAELELPAVALVDRNGLYGAPRFLRACREVGVRPIVGAEVELEPRELPGPEPTGPLGLVPEPPPGGTPPPRLVLLVENARGYRNLCRLLTEAARGRPKGRARASWRLLGEHAEGLHCLTGGGEGLVRRDLALGGVERARRTLERLAALFPGRLHVELQRHGLREQEHANRALVDLARRLGLPPVATGGVRHARREERDLADLFTCLRHGLPVDRAGRLLAPNAERHLRSGHEMAARFADLPEAVVGAAELAGRLGFTLGELPYRFPAPTLPPGETPISHLRRLTWREARARFRPLTARAQAQLERELELIGKLDLAGYFLIVHDIVQFCRREGILVQGRGSAANSAVCYALSITAVDPVRMELLFERFLSEERGEWPDIDLDLPSGEQREKVIQYVYRRHGPDGAAMTANVITWRDRSATREVGRALGLAPEQVDRLARRFGRGAGAEFEAGTRSMEAELRAAGLDPEAPRVRHFSRLWWRIQHLPRHLGQHSGGMVLAAGRLDEVVPLEPAAMEDRTVVQWDKDDLADLGLIKVDLLGLGMLAALEEAIPLVRNHEGVELDLAHLPPDDPATYEMIRAADTVGVFQIESRAQMASLPRNAPRRFYDLVVQVAIIRPGPISGNMTHPYLERRQGRQPVTYPHPDLEPVLRRTLGVPLFQEQLLRIAMVAAGFSGGEAEELRRAMGFKRSRERMRALEERLRRGMEARGITGAAQQEIVRAITSFALYGFPESHAASFALIVYASAYLKRHHPAAFYTALLNAWPMGFYHPATLVRDARRHGVRVLPVDVQRSGVRCTWEGGAVRLGLRYVKGLPREAAARIEAARGDGGPFRDLGDLASRAGLDAAGLERLAWVGALASLGHTRREALWQAAEVGRRRGPLLESLPVERGSPLPEMSPLERTLADYGGLGLTTGPHLMTHLREAVTARGALPVAELEKLPDGAPVRVVGAVITRQRPGTAKGTVFLTVEDETGMVQAIVRPELFRKQRALVVGTPVLLISGRLQRRDGTLSVLARRFEAVPSPTVLASHDFH